jgi:hypothetical protein
MTPVPIIWLVPGETAEVLKDGEVVGTWSREEADRRFRAGDGNHLRPLWRAPDGREFSLSDAPIGAVWDCDWLHDVPDLCGPDGRSLCAKCPGGQTWFIDSRASNCTLPHDKAHRCWVRHGRPEDGTLHVDKDGLTCAAGAGSIQTGNWHGFLHHGKFVS